MKSWRKDEKWRAWDAYEAEAKARKELEKERKKALAAAEKW